MCMQPQVTVRWPKRIELENGEVIDIDTEDEITSQKLACLVNRYDVDKVYKAFRGMGFRRVLALPLGEKYSIAKKVNDIFEIHVRIFSNGLILSEVEISREFVEHIFTKSINYSYEMNNIISSEFNIDCSLIYCGVKVVKILDIVYLDIVYEGEVHPHGTIIREIVRGLSNTLIKPHISSYLQQLPILGRLLTYQYHNSTLQN